MGNWFNSLTVANRFFRKREGNPEALGEKGLDEEAFSGVRSSSPTPAGPPKHAHKQGQADTEQIGVARSVSRKAPMSVDSTGRLPQGRANDPTINMGLVVPPSPPLPNPQQPPPVNDTTHPTYLPTTLGESRLPRKPVPVISYDPPPAPPQFVLTRETPATGLQRNSSRSTVSPVSCTGPQRWSIVSAAGRDDQRAVHPNPLAISPSHHASQPISPSNSLAVLAGNPPNESLYCPNPPSPPLPRGSEIRPLLDSSRKEQGTSSSRASVGEWAREDFLGVGQRSHSRDGSVSPSSVYSTDLTHHRRGERLSSAPWPPRPSSVGVDTGPTHPDSQRQSSASLAPSGRSHSHVSEQFGDLYDAYYRQSTLSKADDADDHNTPPLENGAPKNQRDLTLAKYTIVEVPSPLPSPMGPA
ncbi:MAG: hypothetical protein M1840_000243 [Geoglossum simile]|nr:MAG: hypothetical protein M1840_000243 [Geoglossum simile]